MNEFMVLFQGGYVVVPTPGAWSSTTVGDYAEPLPTPLTVCVVPDLFVSPPHRRAEGEQEHGAILAAPRG